MTEDDARDWLSERFPRKVIAQLERFVSLLGAESQIQSLIARSTVSAIWSRHIVDSAQLVDLAPSDGDWLDIGSGGGLPGIVIGILRDGPVVLSEPRRKRAQFLTDAVEALGLAAVSVQPTKAQNISSRSFGVISARAVASLEEIFGWSSKIASRETRFLLPRGQSWAQELAFARRLWHGEFHVEQSLTDPTSGIVIAEHVQQR